MNLDRIEVFVKVAQMRNFSGAARLLGLSPAAVSKQVHLLEEEMGIKLLHRTTRLVTLTEAGQSFFVRANSALHELHEAIELAGEEQQVLRGTLRVSAPVSFGHTFLLPLLAGFAGRYPDIKLEVTFDDRMVDVVAEGFDVVIRIGPMHDSSLMMKPLGMAPFMMVASPVYLRKAGVLKVPADLKQHRVIGYANQGGAFEWSYQGPKGIQGHIRTECTLRTNSAEMMREAVLAGLGVALLPKFMVGSLVADGALADVLGEYVTVPLRQVVALTVPTRHRTAKVQAFLKHLNELVKLG